MTETMRRKIDARLDAWADGPRRRPLLLLGARQVGKTFSARRLGERRFANTLTVNFQTNIDRLTTLFSQDLMPQRIIADLAALYGTRIDPSSTLLVFDEIQLCQPAITSLKYFAEDAPDYAIIATGSQFGVTIHRDPRYSFPVGKVAILHHHPLDFEEYLWAHGRDVWAEGIRDSYERLTAFPAHDEVTRLFRAYLMTGGMPGAVATWLATHDWVATREAQREISALYTADMAIYLDDVDAARAQAVWRSIPGQLARETTSKFKLSDVASGARSHHYDGPFAWLDAAAVIHRHYQASGVAAPLEARDGGTYFKVYMVDVGLLAAAMGIRPDVFLDHDGYTQLSARFRGAIAENHVKQALAGNDVESMYWTGGRTAEVDFLIVDDLMRVIPVEVKSADNVKSKSLASFVAAYEPPYAVRLSTKNYGFENTIVSIPLYSAHCLTGSLKP